MQERLIKEIALLREQYPNLVHGQNYDWVMLPDFPLPHGYNMQTVKLMFLIPASYPHAGPDCFYVEKGLRRADGSMPANYNEHMDVPVGGSWGYFSWHPEVWQPAGQIEQGDNLLTFMRVVRVRLREVDE